MNARHSKTVLLACLLLFPLLVIAQEAPQQAIPALHITLQPGQLQLQPGKPATLGIRIAVPAGHHAYLDTGKDGSFLPIKIDLSAVEQAGIEVRPVHIPPGTWDARYHATVLRREGVFEYELTALSGARTGSGECTVMVGSQICNDANGSCYFPRNDTLHFQVHVSTSPAGDVAAGGSSAQATAPVQRLPAPATGSVAEDGNAGIDLSQYTPRSKPPAHGLPVWLLLAFLAGLVMNIMPCVLPVVSLKVLSLVQQAGESRARALGMGVAFAAGMLTVFLALAALAILFGLGWGEQFQSQTFLVAMIALVFAFALSLFGVYEFGMPPVGALAARTTREGLGSAFLKGMLATLLATPCSGPFLGSTLAWTLTQPPVTVLLIFLTLGCGMAFPYVVLSAHPALLKRLPKPGEWMETFKHTMGFFLLATVLYLMVSLNQQYLLLTIVFLFCVAVGGWIWGRFSVRSVNASGRMAVLATTLLVISGGAFLSFHTLRGVLSTAGSAKSASLAWEPFDPVQLLQYQRAGRSVLIDFTADWCANCKFNEIRVYDSAVIRRQLRQKHVIVMKADLTREGPSTAIIRRLMQQLGARSIPFLAVFPGNQPRAPYTLHDLVDTTSVSTVLKALPDR